MTEAVKKEEVPHLVFAVTLAYFGVTFLLTRMARSVLVQWTSKEVHPFANDILSTFQVIACSLENRSTKQTYGDLAFTFQLFVVGMLHSFTLTGCGNPCGNMVRMLTRKDSLAVGCLKMALQLLGGVMAWFYAKRIWSLGLSELHAQRYVEKECLTDLNTDVGSGCLLEFGAALCLLVISRDGRLPLVVQMALDSLITVSAVHLTGMYYNPANATIQTFGCSGATNLQFFAVYWIAPLAACYLTILADGLGMTYRETKLKTS